MNQILGEASSVKFTDQLFYFVVPEGWETDEQKDAKGTFLLLKKGKNRITVSEFLANDKVKFPEPTDTKSFYQFLIGLAHPENENVSSMELSAYTNTNLDDSMVYSCIIPQASSDTLNRVEIIPYKSDRVLLIEASYKDTKDMQNLIENFILSFSFEELE
jgi:hypothetical protein